MSLVCCSSLHFSTTVPVWLPNTKRCEAGKVMFQQLCVILSVHRVVWYTVIRIEGMRYRGRVYGIERCLPGGGVSLWRRVCLNEEVSTWMTWGVFQVVFQGCLLEGGIYLKGGCLPGVWCTLTFLTCPLLWSAPILLLLFSFWLDMKNYMYLYIYL